MSAKKFNTPFALLGDKVEIPTTAQVDGSVSFQQGYPFGYEADYTDPNTKDISRSKTNQLLFDITDALREIQQGGVSEWSEEGKPYKINSLVYAPDGTVKQSLIANNNNDITHSSWSNLVNASSLASIDTEYVELTGDQTIDDIKTFLKSPVVPTPTTENQAVNKAYVDSAAGGVNTITKTGEAIFNRTTQQITLTGIGLLDFQIGDVIEVTGSASNNKLFTVEGKGSNYLTVNYECRSSASKGRLTNETASNCTIKLYNRAKNAPIGQGQDWVLTKANRINNAINQNLTNRTIEVSDIATSGCHGVLYSTDGINFIPCAKITSASSVSGYVPMGFKIPPFCYFKYDSLNYANSNASELR